MNNQELKEALLQRYPVSFRGITYDYISAIIYRAVNGEIIISAELTDKNGKSVTIAAPDAIRRKT